MPEGYKKTKVGIVPEEWDYEKLEKYLIQYHEISKYNNQYPVLTSSRKGIYLQADYYNREVASEDNTGYNVVPRGYFTYRHMSDDEIFKFNINTIVDKGIVSTLYPVFTAKNINNYFLRVLLNEGREFRRYAILQKQGGSRTYMYFDKLKQLKVCLPPLPEQEKIAEILQAQDKLIELQQKKIDELKKLKKVYLSKMFPKKGCNVPEIRFPGFTDPWEQRKVSDVAEICTGGTPSTGIEKYWYPKEIPWLSSGEVHKKYITYTDNKISVEGMNNSSARMIPENSVLIALAGQGKTRGTVAINRIPLTTNQSIAAMAFSNEVVPEFVFCNLESRYEEIRRMSSGDGSRGGLNKQIIGETEIPYTSKEEQTKIGAYFFNLDNLITLHQRKCDEEKQKKKALMQLLLTGIVRVEVKQ